MPDWRNSKYSDFKLIIEKYFEALNTRNYDLLHDLLSEECIMSRGEVKTGKLEIIKKLKMIFNSEIQEGISFELQDATAGYFSKEEAQLLIYTKIYKDGQKEEIFVESLFLKMHTDKWLIDRIFGLTQLEKSHYKYNY